MSKGPPPLSVVSFGAIPAPTASALPQFPTVVLPNPDQPLPPLPLPRDLPQLPLRLPTQPIDLGTTVEGLPSKGPDRTSFNSTRPTSTAPLPDLKHLARTVLNAKRIAIVCGAGISTASGIPDFRSSSGLFESLKKKYPDAKLSSGKDLFDVGLFASEQNAAIFYNMIAELRKQTDEVEPTKFHEWLKETDDEGRLFRVYTQNIDALEERAGLSYGLGDTSLPLPPRRATAAATKSLSSSSLSPSKSRRGEGASSSSTTWGRTGSTAASTSTSWGGTPVPVSAGPGSGSFVSSQHSSRAGSTRGGPDEEKGNDGVETDEASQRGRVSLRRTGSSSSLSSLSSVSSAVSDADSTMPEPTLPASSQQSQSGGTNPPAVVDEGGASTSTSTSTSTPAAPGATHAYIPRCIPLHGHLSTLSCPFCQATYSLPPFLPLLSSGTAPLCPACSERSQLRERRNQRSRGVGVLKPDVVLYGESHKDGERVGEITRRDLMGQRPDLLLVVGTTLKVPGTKRLVRELAKVIKPPPPPPLPASSTSSSTSNRSSTRLAGSTDPVTTAGGSKPIPKRLLKQDKVHTIFLNSEFPGGGKEWHGVFDVWARGDIQEFVDVVRREREEEDRRKRDREDKARDKAKDKEVKAAAKADDKKRPLVKGSKVPHRPAKRPRVVGPPPPLPPPLIEAPLPPPPTVPRARLDVPSLATSASTSTSPSTSLSTVDPARSFFVDVPNRSTRPSTRDRPRSSSRARAPVPERDPALAPKPTNVDGGEEDLGSSTPSEGEGRGTSTSPDDSTDSIAFAPKDVPGDSDAEARTGTDRGAGGGGSREEQRSRRTSLTARTSARSASSLEGTPPLVVSTAEVAVAARSTRARAPKMVKTGSDSSASTSTTTTSSASSSSEGRRRSGRISSSGSIAASTDAVRRDEAESGPRRRGATMVLGFNVTKSSVARVTGTKDKEKGRERETGRKRVARA